MEGSLNELAYYRLERAKEMLLAAEENLRIGQYKTSLNRSYYAIFHAMRATNILKNYDSSKHSGVIAFFNKEYLKEDIFDRKLSVIIKNSSFLREKSDYDDFFIANKKDVEKQLENAKIFVSEVEKYISSVEKEKTMRTLHTDKIIEAVKKMCISANLYLADDMDGKIRQAAKEEDSTLGKQILNQLIENMEIAGEDKTPICQDTGMAVFFVNVGQDLHIEGMNLTDAINEGVRRGYTEGYLRKSVVRDPLLRENTGDNTPAIIHYDIVPGDQLEITIAPKGFGSENMSKVYMLKPADGEEGIRQSVLAAVKDAGPNACPPMVVGVGLGGDFELAAKLAKKALTRPAGSHSEKAHIAKLEDEILELVNKTGIGPGGLGGKTTALAVNIETYATHIAGMPLAVNMCCHVNRHKTVVL